MFSDDDLNAMRATQVDAMPDRCTIRRRGMTSDGFGGHVEANTTIVATNVPCRIAPAQVVNVGGQGDRQLDVAKYTIRMPHDTDLRDRDIIDWAGMSLDVEDVKLPRSWNTALSAQGEKRK